jgi:hypothetical protein
VVQIAVLESLAICHLVCQLSKETETLSTMKSWFGRDTERSPLLKRPPHERVASAGPSQAQLDGCDVFNTILLIRQDVIEHIGEDAMAFYCPCEEKKKC